jgi:hypothetical protein
MFQNLFKAFSLFKLMAKPEKVLTEDLWRIIKPLLPKEKPFGTPGMPNRKAILGIVYPS